jgi:hypothetical protein
MECKIVEDIGNGSPVEAERILSEILVLESKFLTFLVSWEFIFP